MIPLDQKDKWTKMAEEAAERLLWPSEFLQYESLPLEEREGAWSNLLERPISSFTFINELFFRGRWEEVFRSMLAARAEVDETYLPDESAGTELVVLEIASGDADMIPQMMGRVFPGSRYITANMNKALTASLLHKTVDIPVEIKVIEEDAVYLAGHLGESSIDLVVFQHAVNDVLQAILCARDGIDTIEADWMTILPDMIKILQHEVAAGTFEASVKTPFLALIDTLRILLKPGGVIAMNHYMFQLDLDWGYPPELFEKMIPMVRDWLKNSYGFREVYIEGFPPNWWIFLRKTND